MRESHIVTEVVDAFADALPREVYAVLVGGSTARGDWVPGWSDLDLLVVVSEISGDRLASIGLRLAALRSTLRIKIGASLATIAECRYGPLGATGLGGKEIRMLRMLGDEARVVAGGSLHVGLWVDAADTEMSRADTLELRRGLRRMALHGPASEDNLRQALRYLFTSARLRLRLAGVDVAGYEPVADAVTTRVPELSAELHGLAALRRCWPESADRAPGLLSIVALNEVLATAFPVEQG